MLVEVVDVMRERGVGGGGGGGDPGVNIEISEHPFISYMTQWLCLSIYWC